MLIDCLRSKTPDEVRKAVAASSPRYLPDWVEWSATDGISRPIILGKILRKWQATRPRKMRRSRSESRHESPYLDDLIDAAQPHLKALASVAVIDLADAGPTQDEALRQLWNIFAKLPVDGLASCVGISKAVMLMTSGRIGPAFDSRVSQHTLGQAKVRTSADWIAALRAVGEDIRAFEAMYGVRLPEIVPVDYRMAPYGRLYDMAFGPR